MNKKAIAIGQVFIFIVAAITFALIMIFGYRSVAGFIKSGEEVGLVQFKTDLESSIQKIYTEYGAVRVETFRPPARFEKICFVDMSFCDGYGGISGCPGYNDGEESLCDESPVACNTLETAWLDSDDEKTGYEVAEENVFLSPLSSIPIKTFRIKIAPEEDDGDGRLFLCQNIRQGAFTIVLEGKGSYTQLAEATSR